MTAPNDEIAKACEAVCGYVQGLVGDPKLKHQAKLLRAFVASTIVDDELVAETRAAVREVERTSSACAHGRGDITEVVVAQSEAIDCFARLLGVTECEG